MAKWINIFQNMFSVELNGRNPPPLLIPVTETLLTILSSPYKLVENFKHQQDRSLGLCSKAKPKQSSIFSLDESPSFKVPWHACRNPPSCWRPGSTVGQYISPIGFAAVLVSSHGFATKKLLELHFIFKTNYLFANCDMRWCNKMQFAREKKTSFLVHGQWPGFCNHPTKNRRQVSSTSSGAITCIATFGAKRSKKA